MPRMQPHLSVAVCARLLYRQEKMSVFQPVFYPRAEDVSPASALICVLASGQPGSLLDVDVIQAYGFLIQSVKWTPGGIL